MVPEASSCSAGHKFTFRAKAGCGYIILISEGVLGDAHREAPSTTSVCEGQKKPRLRARLGDGAPFYRLREGASHETHARRRYGEIFMPMKAWVHLKLLYVELPHGVVCSFSLQRKCEFIAELQAVVRWIQVYILSCQFPEIRFYCRTLATIIGYTVTFPDGPGPE